jgi:hypothetical protein
MSDTPQTDNLARGNHVVPTEFAQNGRTYTTNRHDPTTGHDHAHAEARPQA